MEKAALYQQIYDYICEEISAGNLKNGDRVPTEKELCARFSVSRITSKKALDSLAEQGLIVRFPGKGSFVRDEKTAVPRGEKSLSNCVGLLVPQFSDNFGIRLLYGISDACDALNYHLIVKWTQASLQKEEDAIRSLTRSGITGFLLMPIHGEFYNPEILKLVVNKKPLVFVDRRMRGLAAPSVSTDNVSAAAAGVEYLLRLGHRHIAFYSGPVENTSTIEDRWRGFVKALSASPAGRVSPQAPVILGPTSGWGINAGNSRQAKKDLELISAHLSEHPEISAAFTTEHFIALLVKKAALSLGRRVPEDFSILCFDAPHTILSSPSFTHLRQDEGAIGKQAVETLHRIISGETEAGDVLVPAKLIPGSSTAPFQKP